MKMAMQKLPSRDLPKQVRAKDGAMFGQNQPIVLSSQVEEASRPVHIHNLS
jgi:hypothetical protein